ncbi:MAG TPA: DUF1697 domain-containing protein [Mycobacteriales bacterium]|nr:DUF1697 domain-containing protein [Mycobacteriales bacterium]
MRYVALLRAVNLGSYQKVPMAKLRELASAAGFAEVSTYLQSGNLVVSSTWPAERVGATVGDLLAAELGIEVEVMVRSRDDIADIVAADVLGDVADDPAKRLVSFLSAAPPADRVAAVDVGRYLPEQWAVRGRELYLWCPNGIGRSKLATAPWLRLLGVTGTARNWRTVTALLDLLDE